MAYSFTKQDFVNVTVTENDPIPPNSNPFHYDESNMGSELVRGWVVMHPGYGDAEGLAPLNYMILVNTVSGQRIRLTLSKKESK